MPRSSVSQLYDQIIDDLLDAEEILPLNSIYKTRPNRKAVWALLARIYLSMADFDNAKLYADKCLGLDSTLIDYKTLNPDAENPFPLVIPNGNDEVIYYSTLVTYMFNVSPLVGVDTLLVDSYQEGDLRKNAFFTNRNRNINCFTGNYSGDMRTFNGLATDELLLIKAECLAREGNVISSLETLNYLLKHRYDANYQPIVLDNPNEVLKVVLEERRKELVGRGGLRWADLRRLHSENEFQKTLIRYIDGRKVELPINEQTFTFPIPYYEE